MITVAICAVIKLATAPIVGWSNSTVYGKSVPNRPPSIFENSVAAIESSPAAMSGVSIDIVVPCISRNDIDAVSTNARAS